MRTRNSITVAIAAILLATIVAVAAALVVVATFLVAAVAGTVFLVALVALVTLVVFLGADLGSGRATADEPGRTPSIGASTAPV